MGWKMCLVIDKRKYLDNLCVKLLPNVDLNERVFYDKNNDQLYNLRNMETAMTIQLRYSINGDISLRHRHQKRLTVNN